MNQTGPMSRQPQQPDPALVVSGSCWSFCRRSVFHRQVDAAAFQPALACRWHPAVKPLKPSLPSRRSVPRRC